MPRIRIEAPGLERADFVELADGEGVVIGRAPVLDSCPEVATVKLQAHVIPAPSVSGTHAVVWIRDQRAHLRDLGSRNGSWMRLGSQSTEASLIDEVAVRVGFPASRSVPRSFEPPDYKDESEFGEAIARRVREWLHQHGIVATVTTAGNPPPSEATLRLASGEHLVVRPEHTVDAGFQELMGPVARYVAGQNALFEAEHDARDEGMILTSAAIRSVHLRVVEAAHQRCRRLVLLGPSGTGKERLARAYHHHVGSDGPVIAVNCATLTRERFVADMFGAEAGAYTGAQRIVIGAVERADGGTLFLDEIGELPLDVQAHLLRFLDTGEYQRLGATGVTRTVNVNVVAATNRDLRAMVTAGTFRLDLFFRLALEVIEIPPLRERFEDAAAYLARVPLGSCSAADALQPDALELLRQHAWPGNFRELLNFALRIPRASQASSIGVEDVRRLLGAGTIVVPDRSPSVADGSLAGEWTAWLHAAAEAFGLEQGSSGPRTWADVTSFIERFLKPYALVHIAGVANAHDAESIAVSKVADAIKADRGTVMKQLRRYFDSLNP